MRPRAPAAIRIPPTTRMSTPATVAWTAKAKIAPTASRKMLKPIPMVFLSVGLPVGLGWSFDGQVDADQDQRPEQDGQDGRGDTTHRGEVRQVVVLCGNQYPDHQIRDGDNS